MMGPDDRYDPSVLGDPALAGKQLPTAAQVAQSAGPPAAPAVSSAESELYRLEHALNDQLTGHAGEVTRLRDELDRFAASVNTRLLTTEERARAAFGDRHTHSKAAVVGAPEAAVPRQIDAWTILKNKIAIELLSFKNWGFLAGFVFFTLQWLLVHNIGGATAAPILGLIVAFWIAARAYVDGHGNGTTALVLRSMARSEPT